MSANMVPAEAGLHRPNAMAAPDQLLARVAAGDRDAMRQCIDRYGPLVWAIALRILRNEAEAEDAVQDAFIALWKSADRFDPRRATEKVFVAMIARRRIIDRRRSLARAPRLGSEDELLAQANSDHLRLERTGEAREAAAALLGLPEDRQKVIRLAVFDGLTHDEIAATTGIPLGTVKSHVKRGLATVRDVLLGKQAKEGRAS